MRRTRRANQVSPLRIMIINILYRYVLVFIRLWALRATPRQRYDQENARNVSCLVNHLLLGVLSPCQNQRCILHLVYCGRPHILAPPSTWLLKQRYALPPQAKDALQP